MVCFEMTDSPADEDGKSSTPQIGIPADNKHWAIY